MLKQLIRKFFYSNGYEIDTLYDQHVPHSFFASTAGADAAKQIDLPSFWRRSNFIPGMTSVRACELLYSLCLTQELEGDVLEVGSWQGTSSAYLAQAVKASGNGHFYAVDHFKGNVGKSAFYRVGKKDLSDLRGNFERNMREVGVWDGLTLLDMPNDEAFEHVKDKTLRFVYLDGDHTKAGVARDIKLFLPLTTRGSIVVFDDFSTQAPGLIEAIEEMFKDRPPTKAFSLKKTLVVVV